MPLVLRERTVGPITLLELGDRLTIENVPELRDKIQGLAERRRLSVLVECNQIATVDSQGLGGLVRNWLSLRSHGGQLKLLSPSRRLLEVLKMTRLNDVIESFDDIEPALRGF
jgi:anti-sigma B factor antagonist